MLWAMLLNSWSFRIIKILEKQQEDLVIYSVRGIEPNFKRRPTLYSSGQVIWQDWYNRTWNDQDDKPIQLKQSCDPVTA